MKPEPLKDKKRPCCSATIDEERERIEDLFWEDDMKSAVEWLKNRNERQRHWLEDIKSLSKEKLLKYISNTLDSFDKDIDKAFEDVMKK